MLAFAPLTGALAQSGGQSSGPSTNNNSDNSAATAPAAPAPAAPAPAAPANPAPASAASSQAAAAAATTPSGGNAPTTNLGNVAVTGTAIARTDAATSLPVTVITKEQLQAQGITSTAEALRQIPENNSDAAQGVGSGASITGGGNFADLRGLGPRYTLILLNGRRLSNDAFRGGTVDINTIPFTAIKRIEVLRDGASSLYGTDAVAGVINFITKKDYQGGDLAIQYNETTRSGGGNKSDLEATFGYGDLAKDGWNVMVTGSYRRQNELSTTERPSFFVLQDLARGVNNTSSFPAPGNYYQGATPLLNPRAPDCNAHLQVPSGGASCRFNYPAFQNLITPRDNASVYARGTFKFNDRNKVSLSYLYANNQSTNISAPGESTGPLPTLPPSSPYFPGNGITPAPTASQLGTDADGNPITFSENDPINLFYRVTGEGPRRTQNLNQQHRVILDFKGQIFKKTHYDTYFGFDQGSTDISYTGGFYNYDGLQNLLDNGRLNPFLSASNLTPGMKQGLKNISRAGTIESTKAHEYIWNGKLTREIGNWFGGGQVAIAAAAEYKHQQLGDKVHNTYANYVANSGGGLSPADPIDENRDVESVYSELNIPLISGEPFAYDLSLNGSFRYDNYSDIGDTVNPKVSLRYQPIEQVVIRGSYSEGFSAPTLHQEYDPQSTTFTPVLNDPKFKCVNGKPTVPGAPAVGTCNYQFNALLGGNPDLTAQTSKSYQAGIVVSPVKRMSAGVTFWWIEIQNQIGAIAAATILNNLDQFGDLVQRQPNGRISQIIETNQNLAKTETSGVDFSFNYALPTDVGLFNLRLNGTLTHKFSQQSLPGSDYNSYVGVDAGFVQPKWKHKISLSWSKAQWSANVTNSFMTGYQDEHPDTHQNVNSYMTFDASVTYAFKNGIKLELGSDNIFDRDPPFTNQADIGFSGFDARYADPLGRTVFGRLEYKF